jgi:D-3-phosphoglycerate dehydrogenase
MDIKILHIDSNNPILMRQLQELGFENHEDFTSSKEQIEAKIESYHGIVIRSRFKIDKTFLDKASNLQFIARVGAGLESIDCDYAVSKKLRSLLLEGIGMQLQHTGMICRFFNLNKADRIRSGHGMGT